MNKKIIIIGIVFVVCIGTYLFFYNYRTVAREILSFEDCVGAKYPVMESFPRQCKTPDGRIYVEEITPPITYINSSNSMIMIELPFPGAVTGRKFSVIGKARGNWFFEASFPVQVLDKNGVLLAQGIAQAQSDWMTTEFVTFKADISVPESYKGSATLVLKKDNPSGLPEHDASISFPFTIDY